MKNIFKSIWAIIILIGGIVLAIFSKKPQEVKKLNKVIKENKKAEKQVEKELEILEHDKEANKKEITKLKRKLNKTKKEIEDMEDVYGKDDVEDAMKFLKKFAGE